MIIKKGIGVSPGLGLAKAYKYLTPKIEVNNLTNNNPDAENERLKDALIKAEKEVSESLNLAEKLLKDDGSHIFEAHLSILKDEYFLKEVTDLIALGHSATYAYKTISDQYLKTFSEIEDTYLQERSVDISDVTKRVLCHLEEVERKPIELCEPAILVVDDLTPSDTLGLDFKFVKGIISARGGTTSHASIIARTLGIPAVVGVRIVAIHDGDLILVDGKYGKVYIDPDKEQLDKYDAYLLRIEAKERRLEQFKHLKTQTKDGKKIHLGLNISNHNEMYRTEVSEGIGLYRTEFLFMAKDGLPDLKTQVKAYEEVLKSNLNTVNVIRTLDIGGDKGLTYFPMVKEINPFLGKRAIRLSLANKNIFATQLKALLIANKWGNLGILLPMISTLEELIEAKALLRAIKDDLTKEGYEIKPYQLGMMVEVPIAALNIENLLPEIDFVSIGTNDLIQYLFAADRMNEEVSYLYQPFHPSLLKLIKDVTDTVHQHEKWVSVCGEMASVKESAILLLGLGLDELSMNYKSILEIRELFSKIEFSEAESVAKVALSQKTNQTVFELTKNFVKKVEKR